MYKHAVFLCILCYFIVQDAGAEDLEFVILHNNDMHARFEEYDNPYSNQKVGGMGRTAYVIKQARKAAESGEGPPVLYLNGGDTFTGTVWYAVHKWKIVADFMNLLKPDAASLGNHEFDQGIPGLIPYLEAIDFPTVCANINFSTIPEVMSDKIKPSIVVDINGVKVGIIGYITTETKFISLAREVGFIDEIEALVKESEKLDREGVKIIIAVGHSGYDVDQMIARRVPLVDLVIGAHTNTFLWNGPKPDLEVPVDVYPKVIMLKSGERVPVVSAFRYTKYMGQLIVQFDARGRLIDFSGQPIFLDRHVHQDEEALEHLDTYREAVDALKEVIGKTNVDLTARDDYKTCHIEECNFGNLVTDAFVFTTASSYRGPGWTDAPVAVLHAGAIRGDGIVRGDITKADIMKALPFTQTVTTCILKGSELLQVLEHSVHSNGDTARSEFLQVSGLRVVYNLFAVTNHRVVSVEVRCSRCDVVEYHALNKSVYYKIVMTYFLGMGGNGHEVLYRNCLEQNVTTYTDYEAVVHYIQLRHTVAPKLEGRILYSNSSKIRGFQIVACFAVLLSYWTSLVIINM